MGYHCLLERGSRGVRISERDQCPCNTSQGSGPAATTSVTLKVVKFYIQKLCMIEGLGSDMGEGSGLVVEVDRVSVG